MIEKLEPIPVGKAEDLTGKRFKHLTVLYRVANKQNRPTWQCQCDCGNFFTTLARSLKDGRSISCGCASNEGHIKDHTGEIFGKLTVIKQLPERASDGTILWECKCDCGNTTIVRASNLKKTKSCGKCFCGKDLSNQRFGKLVTIKYDHTSSSKKSIWKCQCDCGSIVYVSSADLIAGKTQSCGCIKSKGEEIISQILTDNKITFIKQKTFPSCIFPDSYANAIFDFYVNDTYLIEYDGIQHFKPISGWSSMEAIKKLQFKDQFKNNWCKENNIPLIRIPYTHLKDLCIEDLKLETSNFIINDGPSAWDDKN